MKKKKGLSAYPKKKVPLFFKKRKEKLKPIQLGGVKKVQLNFPTHK